MPDAYPLQWPDGFPRSKYREQSRFRSASGKARSMLFDEIRKLGASNAVVSSNIKLRQDGWPYANQRPGGDPGVAVYMTLNGNQVCLACDQYFDVYDNMLAVAKTIEAMRGIDRWGCSDMLNRMFTGFAQLPAPMTTPRPWYEVLGVEPNAGADVIRARATELAKRFHPDAGGIEADHERMAEINAAKQEGLRHVG